MNAQKLIGILLVLVFCLTACQAQQPVVPEEPVDVPPEEVIENTEPSEPSEPSEPEEPLEVDEPLDTQEPITISFWYPYGEGSWTGDFLANKISEFNENNSMITVEGQSYQDYASIIEGLQRSAAAKNLPAIATIGFGFDDYIIGSGLANPIKNYLGDDASDFLSDFYPALLDVTTYDGKVYGIPLALSIAEIFYHPDLFEQAGLDPNSPPENWQELMESAKTIKDETGVYGLTFALDDPWTFETSVRSNGAELLSEDGTSANLNSESAIKVLQDWGDGVANGSILYNADFMQTLQTFGAKQVAMFAVSSYGTTYYHENLPEVRAMKFPAGEGHEFKSPAGGNSLYLLGNNDEERAAAVEFLKFLTNPEANAEWAINSGYLPTRSSSLEKMGEFIEGFDNYKLAVDSINNVVAPTLWPSSKVLQINQIIMESIEATMLGQLTAEQSLEQANQKVNDLLQ